MSAGTIIDALFSVSLVHCTSLTMAVEDIHVIFSLLLLHIYIYINIRQMVLRADEGGCPYQGFPTSWSQIRQENRCLSKSEK